MLHKPTPPGKIDSCTGKQKYKTKDVAQKIASKVASRSRERLETYRCKHCQAWHIGGR